MSAGEPPMPGEVEVPEQLKAFVREWCDGHHKRDPEGWAWDQYEGWQQNDMLAAALDAFPALADSIRSQERQRVREALEKLPRFVAETDDQTEFGGELEVALVRRFDGDLVTRSALLAALDSLEPDDG